MATLPDIVNSRLATDAEKCPIEILNVASRKKLAEMLDVEREVDDDLGLVPDYSGVAELIGFEYKEIKDFQRDSSPTQALLTKWGEGNKATIGKLWEYLTKLKRIDVIEACKKYILADAEKHLRLREAPLPSDIHLIKTDSVPEEDLVLTRQDREDGYPHFYDAFVCWNPEGELDAKFVHEMEERLEKKGIRLCIPSRDDLPGAAMYTQYASLIKIRCRLMIIVLSESYLKSVQCDFMTKFAHALSPATKRRRLVPVLAEKMDIPNLLRHVTLCDFTRMDMYDWNWNRLRQAVNDAGSVWDDQENSTTTPCKKQDLSVRKHETKGGNRMVNFFRRLTKKNRQDRTPDPEPGD